jgi:Protein of unknown function (DUF3455)
MKQTSLKVNRHFIAFTLLATFTASTFFYSCKKENDKKSSSGQITTSEKLTIPASIELPANLPGGNTRVATYYAVGVQKYKSQIVGSSSPVTYEWILVSPEAELFDASGNKVGTHGAGPHWKLSTGSDSIYAQQFSPPRIAHSPDPNSIDWLLLMIKAGTTPTGIFSNVAYIQRIATTGGKKPSQLPTGEGQFVNIPYTAVYRFTKINQ